MCDEKTFKAYMVDISPKMAHVEKIAIFNDSSLQGRGCKTHSNSAKLAHFIAKLPERFNH